MGLPGERVDSAEGFRTAFAQAIAGGGPALIEIDMSKLIPMAGLGSPPRRNQERA
jgi:acetolactate synthase-1/2/3 large subunit